MARHVRTQSMDHLIGPDGRLTLRVTSADVRVRGTKGERALLRATFEMSGRSDEEADAIFERAQLATTPGSGQLTIEEPGGTESLGGMIGRLLSGRGGIDYVVEIEMPASAELRVETVSGEVTVEGMRGEQRYATTSGDVYLNDGGGSLRVRTVSGDVIVRADRPLAARIEAVSGDLVLSAPRLEALRAQSVSGDVEVEGELARGGEFRVETVSGDFGIGLTGSAAFEVRGISTDISSDIDHRIEGRLDRRRLVIGSGEPNVIFSSMSGDISVRRQRRAMPQPPEVGARLAPNAMADDEQLAILEALERGEISVDEATRRLAGDAPDA